MKYLMMLVFLLSVSCRGKAENDSYLVLELLQRRGLIYWYTPEQREVLRQEIQFILKEK
jgi:hypothetical protein